MGCQRCCQQCQECGQQWDCKLQSCRHATMQEEWCGQPWDCQLQSCQRCQQCNRHCQQSKKCEWCGQQWMPELQSCRLCQTMQGAWAARSTVGLPKLQVRFLATRQEVRVVWPTVALPERCRHCQQCKKREWCGERVDCQSCIAGIASSARSVGGAGNRGGVRAADIGASKKCELVRAIVGLPKACPQRKECGWCDQQRDCQGCKVAAKLPALPQCKKCEWRSSMDQAAKLLAFARNARRVVRLANGYQSCKVAGFANNARCVGGGWVVRATMGLPKLRVPGCTTVPRSARQLPGRLPLGCAVVPGCTSPVGARQFPGCGSQAGNALGLIVMVPAEHRRPVLSFTFELFGFQEIPKTRHDQIT